MQRRLAILMFLQYAVPGAWVPIFSLHLQELGFTPGELAWCNATAALAALTAPLFWGQMADRWLAAERCILICAALVTTILWVLAHLHDPVSVFLATLGFWFFMIPILSLGASLTFRHLEHPEKDFGRVRLWGTVGWACANWALGLWFHIAEAHLGPANLGDSLRWASLLGVVLCCYALTLPATPPSFQPAATSWRNAIDAPLRAFSLMRQRSFAVYCICLLVLYVTMTFPTQMNSLYLQHLGVERRWVPVMLTLGQLLEVTTLAILPVVLLRLELKGTMLLGIGAWTVGLTAQAVGQPRWLAIASLGINGLYVCCFLVAGQVFVNSKARKDFRASAQAMLQFINGTGMLFGHLLVGVMREAFEGSFVICFATAASLAGATFVFFLVGFAEPAAKE